MANLDQALTNATEALSELREVAKLRNLALNLHPPIAEATGALVRACDKIEEAIAIDDELHPEER